MRSRRRSHEEGEVKKISKFMLIPRTMYDGSYYETRWLERAVLVYRYHWNDGWKLVGFEEVK